MPARERTDRVLLVDPTDWLRRRLETVLTEAGFRVIPVNTAGDSLTHLDEHAVGGIVSRHALPDLDGIQFIRSIRISHPTLPVILAPKNGTESLAGEAFSAGASGYVSQADEPPTVRDRLQESLNRDTDTPEDNEGHHRYRHLIEMAPAAINVFDETGTSI